MQPEPTFNEHKPRSTKWFVKQESLCWFVVHVTPQTMNQHEPPFFLFACTYP